MGKDASRENSTYSLAPLASLNFGLISLSSLVKLVTLITHIHFHFHVLTRKIWSL
jgi:hypothetical protein